jgi:hypothetical protein
MTEPSVMDLPAGIPAAMAPVQFSKYIKNGCPASQPVPTSRRIMRGADQPIYRLTTSWGWFGHIPLNELVANEPLHPERSASQKAGCPGNAATIDRATAKQLWA